MAKVEIDGSWKTFHIRVELDRLDLIKLLNNPHVRHIAVKEVQWHGSDADGVTATLVRGDLMPTADLPPQDSPVESKPVVDPLLTAIPA